LRQCLCQAGRASGKARDKKVKNLLYGVEQKVSPPPVPAPSSPEATVSVLQPLSEPEHEKAMTPISRNPREKHIHGLQLWFIPPSNPVMTALYHCCIEKEVHWHVAVLRFLGKGLVEEGYLEKEELQKYFEEVKETE